MMARSAGSEVERKVRKERKWKEGSRNRMG